MPGPFLLFVLWYALCPARIFEDAASDADEVRRTVAEQVVCGLHIRDAAGAHDGNGHGLLDYDAYDTVGNTQKSTLSGAFLHVCPGSLAELCEHGLADLVHVADRCFKLQFLYNS